MKTKIIMIMVSLGLFFSLGLRAQSDSRLIKRETKNDWNVIKTFRIKDGFETIQELIETQKSFIRFGDGEIMLMRTTRGIAFQKYDYRLAQGLREIIFSNDERLLIGIWREYYYSSIGLREPVREWMYEFVPRYYFIMEEFLRDSKIYGSTSISQVYAVYEYYDFDTHYSLMRKICATYPETRK